MMAAKTASLAEALARRGPLERAAVLIRLSFYLTVAGRDAAFDRPFEVSAGLLAGINELQHDITQQAAKYLLGDDGRWPESEFEDVLNERAAAFGVSAALSLALRDALAPVGV